MKKLILCGVLSLLGLSACLQPMPEAEATIESELLVCCADWTCPPTGFETTGCTKSQTTISEARAACNAACSVPCTSPGAYCD
jgi:hypothetical protein